MIPPQMITMVGGFLLSSITKLLSTRMKMKQQTHEMQMAALTKRTDAIKSAREYTGEGFSFTRRLISIMAVGALVVLPVLASAIYPDMPITYGYQETKDGLFSAPTVSYTHLTLPTKA